MPDTVEVISEVFPFDNGWEPADEFMPIPIEKTAQDAFVVNDDQKANWALKKIAAIRTEQQRLIDVAEAEVKFYQTKVAQYKEEIENKIEYFQRQLYAYFDTIEPAETKTTKKYKLPLGNIVLTKSQDSLKETPELLKWMKKYSPKLVKSVETVEWGKFKKQLLITADGKVVTDGGEVVEGVNVITSQEKIEIKLNK